MVPEVCKKSLLHVTCRYMRYLIYAVSAGLWLQIIVYKNWVVEKAFFAILSILIIPTLL